MERWTVRLLGPPEAERHGKRAHLRSRLTWCVLASLLAAHSDLPDGWLPRRLLLERFWPERDSGRTPLRMALTSLRQAFGSASLETDGDRVRLARGRFASDVDDLLAMEARAEAAHCAEERFRMLAEADGLLRGDFLEGCHDPDDSVWRWVGNQRARWHGRAAQALIALSTAAEEIGNRPAAFEAACRAVRFNPAADAAWRTVWRLGRAMGRTPDAQALQSTLTFSEAIPRIAARERAESPLTVKEDRAFQELLDRQIAGLPTSLRRSLFRLSVFADRFGAALAGEVASASPEVLERLAARQLLERDGDAYRILSVVRSAVAARVPTATRRTMERRFLAACRTWAVSLHQAGSPFGDRDDLAPHANRALERVYLANDGPETLGLISLLRGLRLLRDPERAIEYVSQLAQDPAVAITLRRPAATVAYNLCMDVRQFARAACLAELAVDLARVSEAWIDIGGLLLFCAHACHHAERKEDALRFVRQARDATERLQDPGGMVQTLRFEAEILRSMDRIEEALNALHLALRWGVARYAPASTAEVHYQMGVTMRFAGDLDGAETHMRAALGLRLDTPDRGGIADCYRELGAIASQQGDDLFARAFLNHALFLYENDGKAASHAAAMVNYGDVHASAGRLAEARRCYEAALAFWTDQGHADWTERVRSKLADLDAAEE